VHQPQQAIVVFKQEQQHQSDRNVLGRVAMCAAQSQQLLVVAIAQGDMMFMSGVNCFQSRPERQVAARQDLRRLK